MTRQKGNESRLKDKQAANFARTIFKSTLIDPREGIFARLFKWIRKQLI